MRRSDSRIESTILREPRGWFESLEGRQLFASGLCDVPLPARTPAPTPTPPPVVQAPAPATQHRHRHHHRSAKRSAAPANAPTTNALLGTYTGTFGSLTPSDGGTLALTLTNGANGKYQGSISFQGLGLSVNVPAQIEMGSEGQFTTRYVSAKLVVQIKGALNLQTGRMSGELRLADRNGAYRAWFMLDKARV